MWIKVTRAIGGVSTLEAQLINLSGARAITESNGTTCIDWDGDYWIIVKESLDDIAKAIGARDVAELATMRKQAKDRVRGVHSVD